MLAQHLLDPVARNEHIQRTHARELRGDGGQGDDGRHPRTLP